MNKTVIEKTVEIKAAAKNLWRAFYRPRHHPADGWRIHNGLEAGKPH
jgi:hypothetical protein